MATASAAGWSMASLCSPLAVRSLGWIGVRADIHELVAIRRATAEEAAFDLGLRGHGGADADLDPVAFTFRDAAEDGHNQVVRFVIGVDRPDNLGHPQRHPVMREQREGVAELVAIEGALRFASHDGFEASA